MHLVLLGQGQWTVYAVCADETTCPLLDFIAGLDEKRGRKVLSDLSQWVPASTPQDWVSTDFSWQLRGTDSILEFRWPTKKGGTPRVFWFYDANHVIVCSHGVNKKGSIDAQDIKAAEAVQAEYLRKKVARQLTVIAWISLIRRMVRRTEMGKYKSLVGRMVSSVDYWAQAAMRGFVLDIDHRMKAQNISRASLADKLETSPAYVTKVMRGDVNFTLETMTKLALAVGGRLHIQVVDRAAPVWVRTVVDSNLPSSQQGTWLLDTAKKMTQAADTRRLELNLDDAAIKSRYDYEQVAGRAA